MPRVDVPPKATGEPENDLPVPKAGFPNAEGVEAAPVANGVPARPALAVGAACSAAGAELAGAPASSSATTSFAALMPEYCPP